jgi:hypothetical protein
MKLILTRYLYDKSGVEHSLEISIIGGDYSQSLFWAYELYYSGFKTEVVDILLEIYQHIFSKHHPKLGLYFNKKQKETNSQPAFIATMIKNLTMKNPDIQESPNVKFVNVKEYHIAAYATIEPDEIPNWKFLQKVCIYPIQKNPNKRIELFREHWLYHAAASPIWSNRIHLCDGTIDHSTKTVIFANEEAEEDFYDRYHYEPDEQPLELQNKCMG